MGNPPRMILFHLVSENLKAGGDMLNITVVDDHGTLRKYWRNHSTFQTEFGHVSCFDDWVDSFLCTNMKEMLLLFGFHGRESGYRFIVCVGTWILILIGSLRLGRLFCFTANIQVISLTQRPQQGTLFLSFALLFAVLYVPCDWTESLEHMPSHANISNFLRMIG